MSVTLGIQHAIRMAILSSAAYLDLQYFTSHKRHDCQKKLLNIKFVFGFSVRFMSEIFIHIQEVVSEI
jgi:hypothetical protein